MRSLPQERECSGNTVKDVLTTLMSHDRESPYEQKSLSSIVFWNSFKVLEISLDLANYCLCCESFVKTQHRKMLLLLWISHITDFEGKKKSRFVSCVHPGWCSALISLNYWGDACLQPLSLPVTMCACACLSCMPIKCLSRARRGRVMLHHLCGLSMDSL